MVKRTLELYDCDVCGAGDAVRYEIVYSDGRLVLDRCERHGGKFEKLRDEKGAWIVKPPGARVGFRITDPSEILKEIESHKE